MNNTVLKVNVYNIDDEIKLQKINKVQASDYVNSIIKNGLNNKNVRYFRVKRNTTEVINIINKIVEYTNYASESGVAATLESGSMDSFTVATKKIAEKLQENEKIAQERIINLNVDVKKGSLIQALVKDEDGLLNLNKELIDNLLEQLKEKDKQISELHRLIENNQILLKEEQKKSEQQLYLAEHFEEVDNKLQDLKEKMEQKRNYRKSLFKIFSK